MIMPSYTLTEETPDLEDVGVAIALRPSPSGETVYRVGQTVHLDGAFKIDQELYERCGNHPHTGLMLVIVRRDRAQIWSKMAMESMSFVPSPERLPSEVDHAPMTQPSVRGGCFDVDLLEFIGMPKGPARYWVTAYLGDHVSARLSLEIIKS